MTLHPSITERTDAENKARILEAALNSLESVAIHKSIGGLVGVCSFIAGAADIPLTPFTDGAIGRAHYIYRLLSEMRADLQQRRRTS